MRQSIRSEFGVHKPRAIVLDDNANARVSTARRLRRLGFEVDECKDAEAFREAWEPGMVDVILSDWQLSHEKDELGDRILNWVRQRDWDVPFVLISGRLREAEDRAEVLDNLLESGGAGFVVRGENGIAHACKMAQDLIERRDLALLKMVLALRAGARRGETIETTSGSVSAKELLSTLVKNPRNSHDAARPVAAARSRRVTPDG